MRINVLILILLFCSCREETEVTRVKGRLVANCQNVGAANERIQLISKMSFNGGDQFYEGEFFSKENGEFTYNFESVSLADKLVLRVNGVNVQEVNTSIIVDFGTLVLVDSLTLNVNLLPNEAYSANDTLIISIKKTIDTLYGPFLPSQMVSYKFEANRTPEYAPLSIEKEYFFQWQFKKGGSFFNNVLRDENAFISPCGVSNAAEIRF